LLIPAYVYVVMAVALGALMPQIDRSIWVLLVAGTPRISLRRPRSA
jgi:hypothetical protein